MTALALSCMLFAGYCWRLDAARVQHKPVQGGGSEQHLLSRLAMLIGTLHDASAFKPAGIRPRSNEQRFDGGARNTRIRAPLVSRRDALALGAAAASYLPFAAEAAKGDPPDTSRLKKGVEQIDYLLDNWDTVTIDPKSGKPAPDVVRVYVGLRTLDHPLAKLDKLLGQIGRDLPEDMDFDAWTQADAAVQKALSEINELSFTSSFGEYNPGGGEATIQKYLGQSKEYATQMRDGLKVMIKLLKI